MTLTIAAMDRENYKDAAFIGRENLREAWSEEVCLTQVDNPNDHTLIAYADGKPAGFLSVWEVAGEMEINNIAVMEGFRRKGIALELFREMFRRLPHAERAVLEVRASNMAAMGLYSQLGFSKAGLRKRFYTDPEEDAVIMVKEMRREV